MCINLVLVLLVCIFFYVFEDEEKMILYFGEPCELIWNAGEARAVHYLRWLRDSSGSDLRRDLALSPH